MSDQRPSSSSSIQVVQTVPSRITMHTIEDHQLVALTNVSRPLTLAAAGAAFGAFIGLLPASVEAIGRMGTTQFHASDLVYIIINAVGLVAAVLFGVRAAAGEVEARKMVSEIRARQQRPF